MAEDISPPSGAQRNARSSDLNRHPFKQPQAGPSLPKQTSMESHLYHTKPVSAYAQYNRPAQEIDNLIYQIRKRADAMEEKKARYESEAEEARKRLDRLQEIADDDEQLLERRAKDAQKPRNAKEYLEWVKETIRFSQRHFDTSAREKQQIGIIERLSDDLAAKETELQNRPQLSDLEEPKQPRKQPMMNRDALKLGVDNLTKRVSDLESTNRDLDTKAKDQARELLEAKEDLRRMQGHRDGLSADLDRVESAYKAKEKEARSLKSELKDAKNHGLHWENVAGEDE
ncbi:hypothetical protein MMC30_004411 [Trapelia coarctata]|nr:hypothetical protein [Trapelia coarctata]